nr:hypothetical protein [Tanacetum cinerariifolium]
EACHLDKQNPRYWLEGWENLDFQDFVVSCGGCGLNLGCGFGNPGGGRETRGGGKEFERPGANRKSKQVVGSLKHKKPSVFGKVKRLASNDESSESDDESSESDEEGSESDEDKETTPIVNKNCKSETFRSWDWFLRKLKECIIGKQDNLRAVFIASAINNVFPNAFHGFCCRHLLMNLREKCPRFISKEELFWKACKAYRISDFEERFSTLRNWLPSVANKLDMIGLEKWARVHFPGTPEESFAELPLYYHNLKVKNPWNITHIETDDQDRFEIFFLQSVLRKEELFWKACKAYRISDFEEHFSTLRNWLPSVANKLDMIGLEKWARVHFPFPPSPEIFIRFSSSQNTTSPT